MTYSADKQQLMPREQQPVTVVVPRGQTGALDDTDVVINIKMTPPQGNQEIRVTSRGAPVSFLWIIGVGLVVYNIDYIYGLWGYINEFKTNVDTLKAGIKSYMDWF